MLPSKSHAELSHSKRIPKASLRRSRLPSHRTRTRTEPRKKRRVVLVEHAHPAERSVPAPSVNKLPRRMGAAA